MKDITLKIVGTKLSKDEEIEKLEFVTEGEFYCDDEKKVVVYKESEVSGMSGFTTSLILTRDKAVMKRTSNVEISETEIQFEKGARFEGSYETPFGSIPMEILTNELENNITENGTGYIYIDYDISLRGLVEGRSRLNIEILERGR